MSGPRRPSWGTALLLVAGRDRAELEPVIGLFVNTLVVRTDLSDDPGFRALAARVAKLSLEAQHHADFPFERVVDALKPERRLDRNPLVQVLFNFVDFHGYERELGGGLSMAYRVAQAGTDFDLTLVATVGEGALRLELEYDAGRFTPATVRLLGRLNWWAPAPLARWWQRHGHREHGADAYDDETPEKQLVRA